jgi:hypothetical protein
MRRAAAAMAMAFAALVTAGCGQSGSTPVTRPTVRTLPDLGAFLRHPIATPSVCPDQPAQSTGLQSPWRGHVDISAFLRTRASRAIVMDIGRELRRSALVQRVYYESPGKAYAEFQRLYSCWAEVPRSQVPASYRVVLLPTATIAQRNTLVTRMVRHRGVDSVSCDPALPCTEVVRSAQRR